MRSWRLSALLTAGMLIGCGGGGGGGTSTPASTTVTPTPAATPTPTPTPTPVATPAAEPATPQATSGLEIGTYYFPGWHVEPFVKNGSNPWGPIRPYPDLTPMLGYYSDESRDVVRQQADWMRSYGLTYVAFDWYYEDGAVRANGAFTQYLALTGDKPKVSLLWANHGAPTTDADWRAIVALWRGYAADPAFYRIDGRPVIFMFDSQRFVDDAVAAGTTAAARIAYAQAQQTSAGGAPFYFVAGIYSGDQPTLDRLKEYGFSSASSYNSRRGTGDAHEAHSYAELDAAQRHNWPGMLARTRGLSLVVPMTSGYNRQPWGGAEKDPLADLPHATNAEFTEHLRAARSFMTANGLKQGIICCWNEYGEGAVIEPTVARQYERLAAIKAVFAAP